MATRRKDDDGLSFGKVQVGGVAFNMDSTTQIDIPRDMPAGFPVPQRIVVRELEFVAGADGPITWRQPDRPHRCNSLADVAQMIASFRSPDGYDPKPGAAAYHRPLDLHLNKPTCYIIRLSGTWKWRFSHKARGATLGPDIGTNPANYCNLRHVRDDGFEQYDPFADPVECKLLYFFATPPAGNPTPPFQNSFNLNVELLYPRGAGNELNSIPIVVDPDIRFPGGSASEPES